jgi:hypothetical protein
MNGVPSALTTCAWRVISASGTTFPQLSGTVEGTYAGGSEKNGIFLVIPVDEDLMRRREDVGEGASRTLPQSESRDVAGKGNDRLMRTAVGYSQVEVSRHSCHGPGRIIRFF